MLIKVRKKFACTKRLQLASSHGLGILSSEPKASNPAALDYADDCGTICIITWQIQRGSSWYVLKLLKQG